MVKNILIQNMKGEFVESVYDSFETLQEVGYVLKDIEKNCVVMVRDGHIEVFKKSR